MTFEFLDHTADIGVRLRARDLRGLLLEAARAFYAILLYEECLERVEPREERVVELEAVDREALVVEFLQEVLYLFDSRKLLLPHVEVEEARSGPGGSRLRARLRGERFDPSRHALRTEVKAATYHGVEVREVGGELELDIIFDL